jgi:hypothetical protein
MRKDNVKRFILLFLSWVCRNLDPDVCDANLRGCEMWCALYPPQSEPGRSTTRPTSLAGRHTFLSCRKALPPQLHTFSGTFSCPIIVHHCNPCFARHEIFSALSRWHPQSIKSLCLSDEILWGSAREILIWKGVYGNFRDCFLINAKWQVIKFPSNNKEAVAPVNLDCCYA